MSFNCFLSQFKNLRPRFEVPQSTLLEWLSRAHCLTKAFQDNKNLDASNLTDEELNKMRRFVNRFACDSTKIGSRGVQTDDPAETEYNKLQIYKISKESLAGVKMAERTHFFSNQCNQKFEEFYLEGTQAPEHLLHITCTGYASPSGAQHLISHRQWSKQTKVTHAYHMGCYAALPSIRLAQGLTQSQFSSVDLVHTEICTLHLDPSNHSPEQIVVQSLFADGFIKYQASATRPPEGFEVLRIDEFIVPDSERLMTWLTADFGMQMTLSKEVPAVIAKYIENFVSEFQFDTHSCLFAIHPGGPRIIESLQDVLKLQTEQIAHSKQVLFDYGNMSSATLPHIWQNILNDPLVESGKLIMSLAFGPGLTIFGGLLKKI